MSFYYNAKKPTRQPILSFSSSLTKEAIPRRKKLDFVSTLQRIYPRVDIDSMYDVVYQNVLGHSTDELRSLLGVAPQDSVRAALMKHSPAGFLYIKLAEELIVLRSKHLAPLFEVGQISEAQLIEALEGIVEQTSQSVAANAAVMSEYVGTNFATGAQWAMRTWK